MTAAEPRLFDLPALKKRPTRGFAQGHLEVTALGAETGSSSRFDHARTELAFGMRLRRGRRRSDARPHLRFAQDVFEQMGAGSWAAIAGAELDATAASHRSQGCDPDALTPQERNVAGAIARGATNKEAAASLFVSPRTIDAHLQRIYRKLGVHSRMQLANALVEGTVASE